MSHTTYTLALDEYWDIRADSVGGVALSFGSAATAQNVANECRLFTNDAYFAKNRGIPHFLVDLGVKAPQTALQTYLRQAAMRVEDVAEVTLVSFDPIDRDARVLSGDIQFTTVDGDHVALEL